ncbi:cytidine deaminase [Filimonas lacunae]|uniref:Cytidine deaminase n=1 Tax=Filimonas lacunae TaxID=477680 RepID=A0A173MKH1_9BACT|nr:cytidine deaminase [Filimonas lacunae]BAV08142.1 cytidine deaminase [Filimonas lacunae]SIT09881.1 cytidine deaminase [Filimonas lacunae]
MHTHTQRYHFDFEEYNSIHELLPNDAQLLKKAQEVTAMAYAPYSKFHVGAAAILSNGEIITGTNQENASFPAGTCAERSLLTTAATLFPNVPIHTMAISYHNHNGTSNSPISPCGICRQALAEYETRTHQGIRLILGGQEGKVFVIPRATMLLPLVFTAEDMK